MQVLVSGKQIDIGDSLRTHVETKAPAAVEKYFQNSIRANVVFSHEAYLFHADIWVDIGHDLDFHGQGQAAEAYAAFDLALEHLAKQLRRHKRKLRNHRRNISAKQEVVNLAE